MVKVKVPTTYPKPSSPAESATYETSNSGSNNNGAKLWDNEELVMQALRVYGKYPRPQCFNEISRVCKLSNLRKSRYFHEKMMKANVYEPKIRKLIADEGEAEYPFFKIFFEEYRTKKERQKLMSYEEDKHSMKSNDNNSGLFIDNNSEDVDAYENSMSVKNEAYDEDDNNNNGHAHVLDHEAFEETEAEPELYYNENITPLIGTNSQYLENLELKLKILNKEKETMVDYFQTFSNVIDNLKSEIENVKSDGGTQIMNGHDYTTTTTRTTTKLLDSEGLSGVTSLEELVSELTEARKFVDGVKMSVAGFEKEQACLKEDLKLTTNFAHVENRKLQDELNACRAKLQIRDEQIGDLRMRLNDSSTQNYASNIKCLGVQTSACVAKSKFNELKENIDRLFTQIQSLS